jgi:hypothetical protein
MAIAIIEEDVAVFENEVGMERSTYNSQSVTVFEEKPERSDRTSRDAHHLFNSFTASIMQENTLFTR